VTPTLTNEQVLAAMDPNGVIKYGEIVARLEIMLGLNKKQLYRAADSVMRRLKRSGKVELIKGATAGWRIIRQAPPANIKKTEET
jgi:DNA-binding IscR family transcriptional regulator